VIASKEIERLKNEVKDYESQIKHYQDNETMLTNQVNEKTIALRELKAKLRIDPGYHTPEFVEEKMESQLEKMKDCIIETILKNKE